MAIRRRLFLAALAGATALLAQRVATPIIAERRSAKLLEQARALVPSGDRPASTDQVICVLLHGYGTTPAELTPLAKELNDRGFGTFQPWLPGHSMSPAALARSDIQQWADELIPQIEKRVAGHRFTLVGQSIGGTLALDIAVRLRPEGLALVNPFLRLRRYGPIEPEAMIPALRHIIPYVPFVRSLNASSPAAAPFALAEPLFAIGPVLSLKRYADAVYRRASAVTVPTIIIKSSRDRIVDPSSADDIYRGIGTKAKQMVTLNRSGHMATLDWDGDQARTAIADFFNSVRDRSNERPHDH